jgi:hypothetical protein
MEAPSTTHGLVLWALSPILAFALGVAIGSALWFGAIRPN